MWLAWVISREKANLAGEAMSVGELWAEIIKES